MEFIDANSISPTQNFNFDICIIGSGAAGITIANEFDNTDYQVCILEAGGLQRDKKQEQDLYDMDIVGHPIDLEWSPRVRCYGGSTNAWFGRIAAHCDTDFATRPWVPNSGWPISKQEVSQYYSRAADVLKIPHIEKIDISHWHNDPTYQTFADKDLDMGMFLWADWMYMGPKYLNKLQQSPNIQLFLNANVQSLEVFDSGDCVEQVKVRNYNDQTFNINASLFVLACGGNENPRMLLLSNSKFETGLGNEHDVVGRYLIDHPRGEGLGLIHLNPDPASFNKVARLGQKSKTDYGDVQMHIKFSAALQEKHQLLNHCVHAHVVRQGHNLPSYLALKELVAAVKSKRLSSKMLTHLKTVITDLPALYRTVSKIANDTSPVECLVLIDQMEQVPDPESRITLSPTKKDIFGQPIICVDWKISHETYKSQRHMHKLIADKLDTLGIGKLESHVLDTPNFYPSYLDMKHPSGTTRMSHDPKKGVVNADCQVHGIDNLFIAGSSVFPTNGHANPTFTIVSLAIRLSDHMKRKMKLEQN